MKFHQLWLNIFMKLLAAFLLLFLSKPIIAAELFGFFKADQNTYIFETIDGQSYSVKSNTLDLFASIQTLETRKALIGIPDSAVTSDQQIFIATAPTIHKAHLEKAGVLENTGDENEFLLDGELVKFQPGKLIDGTQFDELSRQHFIGKKVLTRGNLENGIYVITSIVEADIFSARPTKTLAGSDEAVNLHWPFLYDKTNYVLKTLPRYELSSSIHSFRGNLFDYGEEVKPGDPVMFFTMSGHQGDDPISANGHLAAGLGVVQEDYSIEGDIFNVYIPPKNRKEIISGNNHWIDYFGHVISGQNNYRPTYTLLIYGVDAKKLQRVRESLERYHAHFRVTNKQMSVAVNCGTLTVKALAREGIYGKERNGRNGSRNFPILPEAFVKPEKMSILKQINYVRKTPISEYMPRNIWESVFKNFYYLNTKEKLGAHRVDFIFYGQTPSHRLRGGIGTNSLSDEIMALLFGKRLLPHIE